MLASLPAYRLLLLAALVLAACAPALPPSSTGDPRPPATGPKTLVVGILQEPTGFGAFHSCTSGGGCHHLEEMAMRYLVGLDAQSRPYPELAREQPSVEHNSWAIYADGTMETIYHLRPNVKWHDGTPMAADDWVFGWEVDRDPAMPNASTVPLRYIDSALALDDLTLRLHWAQTYPFANALMREHLNPMQRARHEPIYRADHERFVNSPAWNVEFIGLGPYRIAEWTQGTQIRYEAFPGYFSGKPRVDTIVVRFLHDPATLLANILADTIDVYLPLGLEKEAALDLQRGWAATGTGNQLLVYADGRLRFMEIQMRPDYQRPKALSDRRTREAMYRAVDRQELMDVVIVGLGKVADSWLLPDDPARPTFESLIPDYSRNTQAARGLLEETGFRRGPDGILINQQTGERFETAVWNTRGSGHDRENSVVADHLRTIGVSTEQYIVPTSRMDDSEHRASFPGASITSLTANLSFENSRLRYRPPRLTEPLGSPRNGYSNPDVTRLVDRLQVAVAENDRVQLQRQIMQTALQDLPLLPLYWEVETITIRKGVTGPGSRTGRHILYPLATWNVHEWDLM